MGCCKSKPASASPRQASISSNQMPSSFRAQGPTSSSQMQVGSMLGSASSSGIQGHASASQMQEMFSLAELAQVTENFGPGSLVDQGGFGTVFQGYSARLQKLSEIKSHLSWPETSEPFVVENFPQNRVQLVVDPRLGDDYSSEAVCKIFSLATRCMHRETKERPPISAVFRNLNRLHLGET